MRYGKLIYAQVKEHRDDYKAIEMDMLDIDRKYRYCVINRVYPKSCYDKAWDYMMEHLELKNLRLVHGHFYLFDVARVDHAWVEFTDEHGIEIVFDGVFQRFYRKSLIYAMRGLTADFMYDHEQMIAKTLKFNHKGAWEFSDTTYAKGWAQLKKNEVEMGKCDRCSKELPLSELILGRCPECYTLVIKEMEEC